MTAGSYMYIGPQGIVHGTTITILNACRKLNANTEHNDLKLFVSSGLGGMSGAQPKAAGIAGVISVIAEVNLKAIKTRYSQGWVDEVISDKDKLISRVIEAKKENRVISIAYHGNIVDLWEELSHSNIRVDIGSDQTSLHNPWAGGYYPSGISFEESNRMISSDPEKFKELVRESLRRQVKAINLHCERGTYFFDYGNAFLLEASRAGANILDSSGEFRYPSYVQDIMGPMCFDYGFGPFRWICCSNDPSDLELTDRIAAETLEKIMTNSPDEIKQQMSDNIHWIKEAGKNKLVVGSQARILYADAEGRIAIAKEFNSAIKQGIISAPVVIGRDHHDVSGTDSPYRETSNIRDGSKFTADMAVQNVIGDAFRGATWVSLHNGGGVGWGEVINGGFGMVLDGTQETENKLRMMLHWDVNNGIARRSWARNKGAMFTLEREMRRTPELKVTVPYIADDNIIEEAVRMV
jgi:urocanate hydratase